MLEIKKMIFPSNISWLLYIYFKCGKCKVSCPILNEGLYFNSTNTRIQYRIKQQLDCSSSFVFIWLLVKSQIILKDRHSNHNRELKNKIGGLRHHYGGVQGCGYNIFQCKTNYGCFWKMVAMDTAEGQKSDFYMYPMLLYETIPKIFFHIWQ